MTMCNENYQNQIIQGTITDDCEFRTLLSQITGTEINGKLHIAHIITSKESVLLQSSTENCKILNGKEYCLRRDGNNGCTLLENSNPIDYLPPNIPYNLSTHNNIYYFMAHENGKCTVRPAYKSPIGGDNRWIPGEIFLSA